MKIIPVILSGGTGTRLWPLSRKQYPKQYLPLIGKNTMLQETLLRLSGIDNIENPIIICNVEHRFLVAEQCQQINIDNPTILLEPIGRNTAPAIAASAIQSLKEEDDAVLLVLSADHAIQDVKSFHNAIKIARNKAKGGKLITFGVVPTFAYTGFGFIKFSKEDIDSAYKVENFIEKPDLETAQAFLQQGNYLWNSGMFMFKADTLICELTKHTPDIVRLVSEAVNNAKQDLDFIRLEKQSFKLSPSISIDYALLEKTDNLLVVPLDAGWSDIGSWSALHDIGKKDINCNMLKGDVIVKDTTNTYINTSKHMITAVGIDNLVVIGTPDATFIATKEKSHEVNFIVESLQRKGRAEADSNRKVHRPWGWFESIEVGKHFQVKRLQVKPGAKLSLQKHSKRSEHWVVVSGSASVINGNDVMTLKEGDSTFIPVNTSHSLENKTNEKLEIIEVQSGSYLGEDDIIRFEDIYGRL